MHCSALEENREGGDVLVAIASLVTEGRIPKDKDHHHCALLKQIEHKCSPSDKLCIKFENDRDAVLNLCKRDIPVCIEVVLKPSCEQHQDEVLLEQWHFSITSKKGNGSFFNLQQLVSAIRSQLYFSQITAWLSQGEELSSENIKYNLKAPSFDNSWFYLKANKHEFPLAGLGNGEWVRVIVWALPRSQAPSMVCPRCRDFEDCIDDRMHTNCKLKGKHRCDDMEEEDPEIYKRVCQSEEAGSSRPKLRIVKEETKEKRNISPGIQEGKNKSLKMFEGFVRTKADLLLEAIERTASSDLVSDSSIKSNSPMPNLQAKMRDISNLEHKSTIPKRILFEDRIKENHFVEIPSASEQLKFRKSLDNAASMVFHSRTGLPLTSSPAPVRRGNNCFDFDSSLNSVSAIKSALFSTSFSTDDESESEGSIVSPCSPELFDLQRREVPSIRCRKKGHPANLLGSFEESVLNGRLEPVSTVHGFKAELGASGSFVPKHLMVPVTVFFYTLGDNDKVSSPYLGHINLGKKGYNVPKTGTVQVTLFNPLGTVVKMFVIMYDLADMPPNSQTFIRQRTLYMPTNCKDTNLEWGPKWLRYLIHLRFMTSKSGKVYLHSDIRMIIFRKCDMDTATAHGLDMSYELRSFTQTPVNPRFSPRK